MTERDLIRRHRCLLETDLRHCRPAVEVEAVRAEERDCPKADIEAYLALLQDWMQHQADRRYHRRHGHRLLGGHGHFLQVLPVGFDKMVRV